jgi:demethylmenaquinone methyltransferase/2-methoxy-6-polyprenyl-1,4-benzoquinol methylase
VDELLGHLPAFREPAHAPKTVAPSTHSLFSLLTGYETVPASAKAPRVRAVFDAVAPAYDLMNDAMSGGLHRLWKDATVAALGPALAAPVGGHAHLDLAGGTGDIARRVASKLAAEGGGGGAGASPAPRVTICDVNEAMMEAGRATAAAGERGWEPGTAALVDWVVGDAEALPFPGASFDTATIAFGLRNVTRPAVALAEVARVLKPGGAFACLEFSQVPAPPLAAAYDAWSFLAIPRLGAAIAGDAAPYQYLVESIRKFPSKRALAGMMEAAGFGGVRVESFAAGAVALHLGWKL